MVEVIELGPNTLEALKQFGVFVCFTIIIHGVLVK